MRQLGVISEQIVRTERAHGRVVAAQRLGPRPGERLDRPDDGHENDELHVHGTREGTIS